MIMADNIYMDRKSLEALGSKDTGNISFLGYGSKVKVVLVHGVPSHIHASTVHDRYHA